MGVVRRGNSDRGLSHPPARPGVARGRAQRGPRPPHLCLLQSRNPEHDAFHFGGIGGIGVVDGEQLVEASVPV